MKDSPMPSGATGSLKPVKAVAATGMNYRGGETAQHSMRQSDIEHGNSGGGSMNYGKSIAGGERTHEHGMMGDSRHDQHIRGSDTSRKTHMTTAAEHLRKGRV